MKMPELPPLNNEDAELTLGWHALNYRTAHTMHAQGMYEELEKYVREYALDYGKAVQEECARVAEQCKEDFLAVRWANEVEWSGKTMAQEIAAAIRKQD